ncbi:MAG TPA: alpha/beta hydrolase [Nocardia sp.]|uniref:RBBP9/YdeN family alpha/beta hydrolase n=1 Tax=Nocardia TaxID=1817 RepID=UPI002457875A|nr:MULTISPECIES: alpha/beta hydrolase [Nocardia]HLS79764.1 alpha/beta hydrolase [Nocardia sp.]
MTATTTPRRASIIHGYRATPDDHWFPWLAARLHAEGIPATVPALPGPTAPDPIDWARAVATDIGTPDGGSIIVAHSLGCLTVLRHLATLPPPTRVGALVLVAGFLEPLPALPELDTFIGHGIDAAHLRERVDHLTVLRSDADDYVPTGHTDRLAAELGTTATVVPAAGHFLATDGVTTLAAALEPIRAHVASSRRNTNMRNSRSPESSHSIS